MDTARVTSGIILLIAGISLCIAGFFSHWFFIYGAILILCDFIRLQECGGIFRGVGKKRYRGERFAQFAF